MLHEEKLLMYVQAKLELDGCEATYRQLVEMRSQWFVLMDISIENTSRLVTITRIINHLREELTSQ